MNESLVITPRHKSASPDLFKKVFVQIGGAAQNTKRMLKTSDKKEARWPRLDPWKRHL